jgi:hypothetical protein
LLIDQVAASVHATEAYVRAWADGRRVFVSSLIAGMGEERAAVRGAIRSVGATPVMFEDDLGAQDVPADEAYLGGVRSSEVYVGLLGKRYGVRMGDGFSATHAELLEAERNGLRLCVYVHDPAGSDGHQRDLIASVQNMYTTSPWTDPVDLGERVERRLRDLAAQDLAPWVRLGRAVFRARQIDDDGTTITVTADIRSVAVRAELEQLRDRRAGDLPFAAPNVARQVQVVGLASSTSSTLSHRVEVTLRVQERRAASMRYSMNGRSPDELARDRLSASLFGTALPEDFRFMSASADPLAPVRALQLDDAIMRPVVQLLITEHLLAEEEAATVDAVVLGPRRQGRCRLRVTWTPRRQYVDEPGPSSTTIEGDVSDL